MNSFVNSPVWASIVAVGGAAMSGLIAMMARLIVKVNHLGDKIDGIATDVQEIREDKDTVRWSDLARRKRRGRRDGF